MIGHASEISTKRAALQVTVASTSCRLLGGAAIAAALARLIAARWTLIDLAVAVAIVVLAGFVEWWAHRFLMHAGVDSWASTHFGTGSAHRRHHEAPTEVRWLFLQPRDATFVVAATIVTVFVLAAMLTVSANLVVADVVRPALTAMTVAFTCALHYEWTHLLVHSAYRPRSRFYARKARHHRLHHYRNERYWLGVTSNLGDRMVGTLPRERASVPISDTARSLV